MESPLSSSSIQTRVEKLKRILSSNKFDLHSFVCPCAYDTAWLAMIPAADPNCSKPMFMSSLEWLLNNQKPQGFWGDTDAFGKPTFESLPATIVSIVALNKWNTGASLIEKGLSFINENGEKLLNEVVKVNGGCPREFAIVFPAMVELAHTMGLEFAFSHTAREILSYIFTSRESYLNKEEVNGNLRSNRPLVSYLEALPHSYVREEDIINNLSSDGSLFQSPSASAKAFLLTGNQQTLTYLNSLAQTFPNGVPQAYPMDEDLIKLCIVNQLQKLGLGDLFVREIEILLAQVYRNYKEQNSSWVKASNMIDAQLHKDSLAFQLLRMHGYKVSPVRFCWFLHEDEIGAQIEKDYEYYSSAMVHVYRASNLMFYGECEMGEASTFSRKLLEKFVLAGNGDRLRQIEYELNLPWFARLDHLEHRMWLEEKEANALWNGKFSYNRISPLYNDELLLLATQNFELKQSIYKNELEELKRWCEELGLSKMGFGREKTTYCYFAISAVSTSLPHDSYIRMLVAKSAIIITVADDFFDMVGSISELEFLTDSVGRWDCSGLSGHSKVIFEALDNLVTEATVKYLQQEGTITGNISSSLRDLWYETFLSWFIEAKWSRNGDKPSIDSYIKTGMTSIGAHSMVLSASCFAKPSLPIQKLRPMQYEPITKLLMVICRLLNDVQSFQKEKEQGKLNSVLVNLIENPQLAIEDSISFVEEIIGKKKKEFLEHVLVDGRCDLPKPTKQLHLSCLKVFQMFFNSANKYDSNTEFVEDIHKAIYLPISTRTEGSSLPPMPNHTMPKKYTTTTTKAQARLFFKHNSRMNFITAHQISPHTLQNGYGVVYMASKVGLGFI